MIWRVVIRMVWCTRVLRAVNVNWNDDGWNVNANSVENPNEWNADNQVFSRNCYFSPQFVVGEFFVCSPFLHPPSIRPISSSLVDNSENLSVGISLLSHASCAKNLSTSSLEIDRRNIIIFCSGGRYEATKLNSRTSRKADSIFWPMPSRSTLGKLRCKTSHN